MSTDFESFEQFLSADVEIINNSLASNYASPARLQSACNFLVDVELGHALSADIRAEDPGDFDQDSMNRTRLNARAISYSWSQVASGNEDYINLFSGLSLERDVPELDRQARADLQYENIFSRLAPFILKRT